MQIIKFFLKHLQDRKGNLPQWDLNPMPLVCRTSTLTARPQRIADLSLITYPSDFKCGHMTVTNIIYKMSSVQFYNCTSVLDGLPSSK